jgi:hypothetical protein
MSELYVPTTTMKKDEILNGGELVLASVLPSPAAPRFAARRVSRFNRIWPVAGLAVAGIVTVAWIGFLGYALFKLLVSAFF